MVNSNKMHTYFPDRIIRSGTEVPFLSHQCFAMAPATFLCTVCKKYTFQYSRPGSLKKNIKREINLSDYDDDGIQDIEKSKPESEAGYKSKLESEM